jgi:soluble lytic murein transglycosylase
MPILRLGLALVGVLLMVTLGCHSTPLKAPYLDVENPQARQWLKDYKHAGELAPTDSLQACTLYKKLAEEEKFPAHELANLRAWETCGTSQASEMDRSAFPPWLQDLAQDVSLKLAQETGDKVAEMELASEKSKRRLPQDEKVALIQTALKRARELNNADMIRDLTRRLYLVAPRLNPQPPAKDALSVASDFRLARDFSQAHRYYEKVVSGKGYDLDDKISALKGLRLAYKNERKMDRHLQACLRLVKFLRYFLHKHPRSKRWLNADYDAEVYYARALWTQGHTAGAHRIFDRLKKRLKGRMSLAEIYWLEGRMADEVKDYAGVAEAFDKALAEKISDPDLHDRILWYSAWNERRLSHLDRAAQRFADLQEQTQDEYMRARALFWNGKTLADAGKKPEAKPVFEKLIGLDPLGYYGLLAHRQLDEAISFKLTSGDRSPAAVDVNIPLDRALAEWLNQLGETQALTSLLDRASAAYRKQKDQNDEGWVTIFRYYAKAGLYMKLYESLSDLTPERRRDVLENHPDLLFPQPWSDEVRTASLQFGVQAELIYSIMRQESAFNPRARSQADAFGLLQVLPEVADRMSEEYKIPYSRMEDLYDPHINIMVGAAHLKDLLSRYKNQFILAVASYNANETAIRYWMKTRFRGDPLEFIEEIPYEETRVYVRLVMRNLIFYSLLNSQSAAIDFPSWVLKLDASAS